MNTEDLSNIGIELAKELSKIENSTTINNKEETDNNELHCNEQSSNETEDIFKGLTQELKNIQSELSESIVDYEETPDTNIYQDESYVQIAKNDDNLNNSTNIAETNSDNVNENLDENISKDINEVTNEDTDNIDIYEDIETDSEDYHNTNTNINELIDNEMPETSLGIFMKKIYNFKRLPKWIKVSSIVFLIILIIGVTGVVGLRTIAGKLQYENPDDIVMQSESFDDDLGDNAEIETIAPEDITLGIPDNDPRSDNNVINILLIGGDKNPDGSGRGRSDAIIIASMNKSQKSLKLTSIMRDNYVQIPEHSPNKINAAYSIGGSPLLVSTIEQNFDIKINGYLSVDFDDFETLIDKLGGLELTLTSAEASYLRRTNYISNKAYRNVVEGTQVLNGNQVLGYTRVRHVGNSDFERTNRHKKVLIAIFNKYKSISITKMIEAVNYILPQIKTNLQTSEIISYATTVLSLGVSEIDTLRIPMDNAYEDKWVGRMRVLLPDYKKNIDELHDFLFGEEDVESEPITEDLVIQ